MYFGFFLAATNPTPSCGNNWRGLTPSLPLGGKVYIWQLLLLGEKKGKSGDLLEIQSEPLQLLKLITLEVEQHETWLPYRTARWSLESLINPYVSSFLSWICPQVPCSLRNLPSFLSVPYIWISEEVKQGFHFYQCNLCEIGSFIYCLLPSLRAAV